MPFDVIGRPSRELIGATSSPANQIIRRFDTFGKVFKANDTATLQTAVDWSAETGIPVGQEGDFIVDNLTIPWNARIIGPGVSTMRLVAHSSSSAPGLITIPTGVVQNVVLSGFSMQGAVSGQHGIYIHAIPDTATGVLQGGLWYFLFEDLELTGFTGETIWLRGYGNASGDPSAFQGPIQFGEFRNVRAFRGAMDKRSLRCSGQVGQIGFDAACQFDSSAAGFADAGTEENILIQRAVHDDGSNESDMAPYTLLFKGTTCQGGKRGITIERANNIVMLGMHFENLKEGIMNSVSAWGNVVDSCVFGLVGINAGAGWGIRNQGGLISCRDLTWNGNSSGHTETHYWSDFDQPIVLDGFHVDTGQEIKTHGITRAAITVAATIDTGYANHVYVNGPSGAITITNIVSQLVPGDLLTIHANAGGLTLGDGTGAGAISLGSAYRAPARIPQDGMAILRRDDLAGGPWKIVTIGGNRGHQRPLGTTVNAAMSPYSIPADLGTVRVDTTAGNVILKLPSVSKVPPGYRVTVVKVSSPDTNICYINGNVTGENPGGFSDNTVRVTEVYQSIDFERNGLIGAGGWDPLAGSSMKNATPGGGATLTFGTHLTGGSYNGAAPVTLGTDANSSNIASTLVARDSLGYSSFSGVFLPNDSSATTAIGYGVHFNSVKTLFSYAGQYTILVSPAGYTAGGRIFLGHPSVDPANYYDGGNHIFRTSNGGGPGNISANDISGRNVNIIGQFTSGSTGGGGAIRLVDDGGTQRWFAGILGSVGTRAFSVYNLARSIEVLDITDSSSPVVTLGLTYVVFDASLATFATPVLINNFININRPASAPALGISSSVGNTGIAFAPNTGSDSVLIDNNRIGSQILFRTSYASTLDKIWLTVNAFGQTQWTGPMQIFNVLTVLAAANATGIDIQDSSGNTGISFQAASSSFGTFIDNRRVGSKTTVRTSFGSVGDTNAIEIFANGNCVFGKIVTAAGALVANSNMTIAPTVPALLISDPGQNVQFVMRPASSSYSAFIDNTRVGAQTVFRNSFSTASDMTWLTVNAAGTAFFGGQVWSGDTFRTPNPSGGTAASWRLGSLVVAGCTPSSTAYVEVEIGGTAVKLATAF